MAELIQKQPYGIAHKDKENNNISDIVTQPAET
jgi:hypothetical protein